MGKDLLLSKYNETIEGEKKKKFTIGKDGAISTVAMEMRKQMREELAKRCINLNDIKSKLANDYQVKNSSKNWLPSQVLNCLYNLISRLQKKQMHLKSARRK